MPYTAVDLVNRLSDSFRPEPPAAPRLLKRIIDRGLALLAAYSNP